MFAKIRLTLSILALLGTLTACGPSFPVQVATLAPSKADQTPTPPATAAVETNPASVGFDCSTVQEIPGEECQGLVAIYESTNGDSWEDSTNSGWLGDDTPCDWRGVACQQGHVVDLQLFYTGLTGHLPSEIGNLTQLKSLYLDGNQISGPVPAEIGKLTELQVARLGDNQFESIPAELTNLKNLIELDLSKNQLSGNIPGEIGNLSNLAYLALNSNQLTGGIPPELGRLTNLTYLDLSNNQLTGDVPASLGGLAKINSLNLSFNQLTGSVPAELVNLMSLYMLDLSYNQLSGQVPTALANAPISELRLWGNLLDGTIATAQRPITRVDYQGVRYDFDSTLADSVWPEVRPAQPPTQGGPAWEAKPEHVRFTFAGPRQLGYAALSGLGPSGQPQIMIYPTAAYGTMSDVAHQQIADLQTLLQTQPSAPEKEIPVLPLVNAAQVFHAQVKYLQFKNGSGVRFITQYSQDISPVTNQTLFYTFQGLTEDGAYYVAAYFPIDANGLPDEPVVEDWDAFSAGYQDYLKQTVGQLDALSAEEFQPDLNMLDQVMQSLTVTAP